MVPEGPLFHKPSSIIAAMNILYATLFLIIINWAIGRWGTTPPPRAPIEEGVVSLVTLVIFFSIIKLIGLGKKWARVVLLVLIVLDVLIFPAALGPIFKFNLLVGVLTIFQALLQALALFFLFSRASTQWFNHVHSYAETKA